MKSIKAGDLFHPDPKLGLQIVFFLQIRVCISNIEHLSKVVPTNCALETNFSRKIGPHTDILPQETGKWTGNSTPRKCSSPEVLYWEPGF